MKGFAQKQLCAKDNKIGKVKITGKIKAIKLR